MASFIDIRALNDAKLQADLKALPVALQRKMIRKGMRTAGNIGLKAAKAAALGYSKGAEGRLDEPQMPKVAKGLKLRSLKRSRKGFGLRYVTPTREELGIPAKAKGYWPAHAELGTKRSPALPFMRWSFDRNEPQMTEAIRADVSEGVAQFNAGGLPR